MGLERLRKIDELCTKDEAITIVSDWIRELGFDVVETDFERPWGGFWKLNPEQKRIFVLSFLVRLLMNYLSRGWNCRLSFYW